MPATRPNDRTEQGSLVSGLALLLCLAMLCGLFVVYALDTKGTFSQAAQRRTNALFQKSVQTQALNRISINNALIIVLLSDAMEGHAGAILAATAHQSAIPFWLSKPHQEELSEQEAVAGYFGAASNSFAQKWRQAYALNQDSLAAWSTLKSQHAGWRHGLRSIPRDEVLCLALQDLAQRTRSKELESAAAASLRKLRFSATCKARCAILVDGHNLIAVPDFFDRGQLPEHLGVSLLGLTGRAPTLQGILARAHNWLDSPLTKWRSQDHSLELGVGVIKLMHPRLKRSDRNKPLFADPIAPMLEPHWAPIYITEQLGG